MWWGNFGLVPKAWLATGDWRLATGDLQLATGLLIQAAIGFDYYEYRRGTSAHRRGGQLTWRSTSCVVSIIVFDLLTWELLPVRDEQRQFEGRKRFLKVVP